MRRDLCVIHLVWAPLGPAPLRRFVEAYQRHPSGADHRLVVVFNGFDAAADLAPWRRELADVAHEELLIATPLLDLAAYRQAAQRLDADRYCFLNSHSVVLADRWLELLSAAVDQPGTGLAGATGSWASLRSLAQFDIGLSGPYAEILPERAEVRSQLASLGAERASSVRSATGTGAASDGRCLRTKLEAARLTFAHWRGFAAFPSPHIRTNGFVIDHDLLVSLRFNALKTKAQAYRIESGREGISAQILRLGLATLVVARDGSRHAPRDWPTSRTFWQAEQENLLVADNQTEDYRRGDARRRAFLSAYAWGDRSAPDGGSRPDTESPPTHIRAPDQ